MQEPYGIALIKAHNMVVLNLPLMTLAQAEKALRDLRLMTQDSKPNIAIVNREAL